MVGCINVASTFTRIKLHLHGKFYLYTLGKFNVILWDCVEFLIESNEYKFWEDRITRETYYGIMCMYIRVTQKYEKISCICKIKYTFTFFFVWFLKYYGMFVFVYSLKLGKNRRL